jgi:type III pantothenate kinase
VFRGGLILPGFDLMRAALARNTAQLPLAEGVFRAAPRNTSDAIFSGCLQAQLGAVERMFAGIAAEAGARCLLTGGARRAPGCPLEGFPSCWWTI